jgi:hypothetical protein
MSRTKSHRPLKARPYGENIDNAANLPTHGRAGSFIRSVNRAMDDRMLRVKSREREELLSTLSTIRSLNDAEEVFGVGDIVEYPCVSTSAVLGRPVMWRHIVRWQDRMDDADMEWATYAREQDDIAAAEREANEAAMRAEVEEYRYWQAIADQQWEAENRCPCCGR